MLIRWRLKSIRSMRMTWNRFRFDRVALWKSIKMPIFPKMKGFSQLLRTKICIWKNSKMATNLTVSKILFSISYLYFLTSISENNVESYDCSCPGYTGKQFHQCSVTVTETILMWKHSPLWQSRFRRRISQDRNVRGNTSKLSGKWLFIKVTQDKFICQWH